MAVRAGLGILAASREIAQELEQERGIPGFQFRVGINTGLVVSGGLTEGEDTTGGETVNLAARLESAAPPGGLLISHATYRHIRGIFNVEKAGPVKAKGFPEHQPIDPVNGSGMGNRTLPWSNPEWRWKCPTTNGTVVIGMNDMLGAGAGE
jgi:class 3 adenylate cyclase